LEKGEFERAELEFIEWQKYSGKKIPNFYKRQIIEGFLHEAITGSDIMPYGNDSLWNAESFLIGNNLENKELYKLQIKNLKEKVTERHLKKAELAIKEGDSQIGSFYFDLARDAIEGFTHNNQDSYHKEFFSKYNAKIKNLESSILSNKQKLTN
jgi:hypothetical protein